MTSPMPTRPAWDTDERPSPATRRQGEAKRERHIGDFGIIIGGGDRPPCRTAQIKDEQSMVRKRHTLQSLRGVPLSVRWTLEGATGAMATRVARRLLLVLAIVTSARGCTAGGSRLVARRPRARGYFARLAPLVRAEDCIRAGERDDGRRRRPRPGRR